MHIESIESQDEKADQVEEDWESYSEKSPKF